jgi:hypothetical protein
MPHLACHRAAENANFFDALQRFASDLLPTLFTVPLMPSATPEHESKLSLRSKDDIEEGSVHAQTIGVLNEAELFEPIEKETDS